MSQIPRFAEASGIALKNPVQIVALDPRPDEKVESSRTYLRNLELSASLGVNLEVLPVVEGFVGQVQAELPVSGFHYHSDPLGLTASQGERADYQATYRLSDNGVDLGEMTLFQKSRFSSVNLAELEDMLCALISPLRNAHKYELALKSAYRDPLTGLGNRNGLEALLPREVELARRHNQSMAVMVMDLDGLKAVNDSYGHDVGDQVIRAAGEVIRNAMRTTDMVYRYGGDEFVGALMHTDAKGAEDVCERIRQGVANIGMTQAINAEVHVSIGLTMLGENDDFDSVFKRADETMYQAKKNGRNQTVVS